MGIKNPCPVSGRFRLCGILIFDHKVWDFDRGIAIPRSSQRLYLASNMCAVDLFERLESLSVLRDLTSHGIVTFTRLAGHLKRDILQPQPINKIDPAFPPAFLPESVSKFRDSLRD